MGGGTEQCHFVAATNRAIGKYDKTTGKRVRKWQGSQGGPLIHLDNAMVMDGKLYAAYSNYPQWPMTSSLEIGDAQALEHAGSQRLDIQWGSFTWVN